MTDDLDPTLRTRASTGAGEQAGMDPEGLLPADPALHDEAATTSSAGSVHGESAQDVLTSPHDQPVEGGVEQADDDGGERSGGGAARA